jgi:hypothetical protein
MIDLERLSEHLERLKGELKARPALRQIVDADLEHSLCALRLMGILPRESAPPDEVSAVQAEQPIAPTERRHGGRRRGAGRRKTRSSADRQREYRLRVRALRKSSLQVPDLVE